MHGAAPWRMLEPGHNGVGCWPVCALAGGARIELPWLAARGRRDGPTLLLLAGVHGDEFEGPAAIWRWFEDCRPARLKGTVAAIPVANPPAYEAGLRVNPTDPKDLARVFPGSPAGTVTERLAHRIQHDAIAHADFMLDLHSAGRLYRIDPWVGFAMVEDAWLLRRQQEAANLLGYPTVWGSALLPGRSLAAAAACGVPALYVEAPGGGGCHPDDVTRNLFAIEQLLRYLEMVDEPPEPMEPARVVLDARPNAGYLQGQITAPSGGFFRPRVALGDTVVTDAPFGEILDPSGVVIDTIMAPCRGRLVFLRSFPIVQPGDALGAIMEE